MQIMDIVTAIVPLVVIIALLYGVLYFIKKHGVNLNKSKNGPVSINVVCSHMIMPKKFISIVRVEDKLLVLGVSDNSITLLKEMNDIVKPNEKKDAKGEKNNFLELFKKNLGIKLK